ncbi:MAG: 50S ribosomal protein L25 [Planctomycetota bacterium]
MTLKARMRDERGSTAAKRMRREGELPANIAGLGKDPRAVAVSEHAFEKLYRSGAQLITIETPEETLEALIREVQLNAFGDKVLHIDFEEIQRGVTLQVEVPLEFFGEPAGVADGGIFQTILDKLTVSCMPRNIPESIEVDVRELAAGDNVSVGDVVLPDGVTLEGIEPDEIVALVSIPVGEEEEPEEGEEAAESGSEPEVIGKSDEEEAED